MNRENKKNIDSSQRPLCGRECATHQSTDAIPGKSDIADIDDAKSVSYPNVSRTNFRSVNNSIHSITSDGISSLPGRPELASEVESKIYSKPDPPVALTAALTHKDLDNTIHSISSIVVSELLAGESGLPTSCIQGNNAKPPPCNDFPVTLHRLLSENKYPGTISWRKDGTSFIIRDRKIFETYVLPEYFAKEHKLASFQKQLRRYRFAICSIIGRDGTKSILCWSPEFSRDNVALMRSMEPNSTIDRKRMKSTHKGM